MTTILVAALAATATSGCLRPAPVIVQAPPATSESAPTTSEPAATATEEPVVDEEITEAEAESLIDELNLALTSNDVSQWSELWLAEQEVAQQQVNWYEGVQAVPMSVRELELAGSATGEGSLWSVDFVHQISGADTVPVLESYELELVRGADSGQVRVGGVEGSGAAYPQLWDLGAIEVFVGGSTVVLSYRDDDFSDELFAEIDESAALTFAQWPMPGVVVMAVSLAPTAQMQELFGGDDAESAGFMTPLPKATDSDIGVGRVVLDAPYAVDELRFYDKVEGGLPLMRHEGAHLALEVQTGGIHGPQWAIEGMPTWWEGVEDEAVADDLIEYAGYLTETTGIEPAFPPTSTKDFYPTDDADGDAVARHYADSALVFDYVAQTYGEQAAIELGTDLNDVDGGHQEAVEEALGEHLGISESQLRSDWANWVDELMN